uniref:AB hydrolase-1 domain-containing protein n=1 Tax=Tetradesmus obliquus TaxID=3088 RepID=A0A383VCC3_TETOB
MLAHYETTTHLHQLPTSGTQKRLLSYIVLGVPLSAAELPEATIIYHHGWPSCRYEALPLHEPALSRKWRVIAVDRYGVGQSTFNPQGSFETWAADIQHLLDALHIQQAVMLGMSGGGPYACACAPRSFETWAADIQHLLDSLHIQQAVMLGMSGGGPYACACARYLPARTAALVTVAGMLATNDPAHADLLQQMHWMDKLHSHIIDNKLAHNAVLLASLPVMALSPYPLRLIGKLPGAVQQLVCRVLTSAGWAEADRQLLLQQPQITWQLLPELMAQSVAQGAAGWGWDMKLTSSAWSFDLRDIKVPAVLVCHGTGDVSLPASMAQRLAQQIPGAQLKLYEGEGHLSLLFRQAEDILASLAAALQRQRQRYRPAAATAGT